MSDYFDIEYNAVRNHPLLTNIYGLKDPLDGGYWYIGKANDIVRRFKEHLQNSITGSKYNKKNIWIKSLLDQNLKPELELLRITTRKYWKRAETETIFLLKSCGANLTNCTNGGDDPPLTSKEIGKKIGLRLLGGKKSEETKKKMSESNSGERNGMYGKHQNEEAKEIISASQKELWKDDIERKTEYAVRMSEVGKTNKGMKLTEEHKEKISEATIGENNPFYGEKHTEETKVKMKEGWSKLKENGFVPHNKGKKMSEEQKEILSIKQKENSAIRGKICITDGITNVYILPTDSIKEGWRKGKTFHKEIRNQFSKPKQSTEQIIK